MASTVVRGLIVFIFAKTTNFCHKENGRSVYSREFPFFRTLKNALRAKGNIKNYDASTPRNGKN